MAMLAAVQVAFTSDRRMTIRSKTLQALAGEFIYYGEGEALIYVTMDWTLSDLYIAYDAVKDRGLAAGRVDKLGRISRV